MRRLRTPRASPTNRTPRGASRGSFPPEQGSMVVPSIASGHYQLCILSLLQLALTPDRSARSGCVDGYLAPLGEFTLDLRAGSAAE